MKRVILPVAVLVALCALTVALLRRTTKPSIDSSGATNRARHVSDADALNALRSLPYLASSESDGGADGVVHRDSVASCPGYTLYAMRTPGVAEIVDEEGAAINAWYGSPGKYWHNAELLPNGDLLAIGADAVPWPEGTSYQGVPDEARYVLRMNWEGDLIWKRNLPAHHDVALTPDGELVLLTFERKLVPRRHGSIPVRDDQFTVLDHGGTVVGSRSLLAIVGRGPGAFPLDDVSPSSTMGPEWIDMFHSNSIEWMYHGHLASRHPMYGFGNVLICLRHQDCIAILDWRHSEVLWSWGKGEVIGPHDAHVLESGNILLFDNGMDRGYSRGIELEPISGTIVWEYRADPPEHFFSLSQGSIQRLPNGNTLLAESDRGRILEVTPTGRIVWEFLCPHRTPAGRRRAIARAKRLPPQYVETITSGESRGLDPSQLFDSMVR